jgi:hypothetical protein
MCSRFSLSTPDGDASSALLCDRFDVRGTTDELGWEAGIRPRSQLAEARRVEPKASCDVKESASHQERGLRPRFWLAVRDDFRTWFVQNAA